MKINDSKYRFKFKDSHTLNCPPTSVVLIVNAFAPNCIMCMLSNQARSNDGLPLPFFINNFQFSRALAVFPLLLCAIFVKYKSFYSNTKYPLAYCIALTSL